MDEPFDYDEQGCNICWFIWDDKCIIHVHMRYQDLSRPVILVFEWIMGLLAIVLNEAGRRGEQNII